MSYWDTSALAKRYLAEPDSGEFMALNTALTPIHTARLAAYELRTTLRRREAEGVIAPGTAGSGMLEFEGDVMLEIIVIHEESLEARHQFSKVLESCFSATPPIFIRASDAIHIATALAAGETEFVSADARQKKAAEVCGLTVHP